MIWAKEREELREANGRFAARVRGGDMKRVAKLDYEFSVAGYDPRVTVSYYGKLLHVERYSQHASGYAEDLHRRRAAQRAISWALANGFADARWERMT